MSSAGRASADRARRGCRARRAPPDRMLLTFWECQWHVKMSGFCSSSNVRCCCWPVGVVGNAERCPASPPGAPPSGLGGGFDGLLGQASVGLVAGQAVRAVEDGEPAVLVGVHPDLDLDE